MSRIVPPLIILLLITLFPLRGFSENATKPIAYSISLKEISNNKLFVECEFQGNNTGLTELLLPHEWANQLELHKNIGELSCAEHTIENSDQPHIKTIHHEPDALITITYSVGLLSENICHENYFRPIGDHSYFYAVGHALFIIPAEQHGCNGR